MKERIALGVLGMVAASAAACGGTSPDTKAPRASSATARPAVVASCARRHPGLGAVRADLSRKGGKVALVRLGDDNLAYVADADDNSILTFDLDRGIARARTPVAGAPAQVLVLEDGRVAVTLRDANRIQVLEPAENNARAPLAPVCTQATPAEPFGIAATPDDQHLVVTSAWARKLTRFDAATLKPGRQHDLSREPRDVLVADDGSRAFVAHVVGGKVSVVDLEERRDAVRPIDIRVPVVNASRSFGTNAKTTRESCQGFALAKTLPIPGALDPKRGRIFAPRVTIEPGDASRPSSGYGNAQFAKLEAPIITVLDEDAERSLTPALIGGMNRGRFGSTGTSGECLLPRAAATVTQRDSLLVACVGTNAIVEYDARGVDPSNLERRRWSVPAGPLGLAVDQSAQRAVVWSQFDRELSVIELSAKSSTPAKIVSAPKAKVHKLSTLEEKGRKIFHATDNPAISKDGRACASCHPDGREDALTWPTPVGPRQTIMLAGRLRGSAPFSWLGAHKSLEVHLDNTFERLGGTGLKNRTDKADDDLDALIAYLEAMPAPVQRGALPDPRKAKLIARGEALFQDQAQGCERCHSGGGTDASQHKLAEPTAAPFVPSNPRAEDGFDTPSLRFVGGTAPYFHDGRFATLEDLLMNPGGRMGHTLHLSRRDALALTAYLETL